eukprot:CAMPEP_0204339094 /NCGR_PEP_ID=MMETSP0469-20131031/21547_1 /ASSEMBLY_ACC=CAM_ASM_000384 /TAXON_ID=2969 /ORGANISM="Oxyrrhis marina" /LENGTH=91 /DNA_ID=CAMNT_0051323393 /DNA_START=117 /DNA_END=389 /DNA_ORIENTATION=+
MGREKVATESVSDSWGPNRCKKHDLPICGFCEEGRRAGVGRNTSCECFKDGDDELWHKQDAPEWRGQEKMASCHEPECIGLHWERVASGPE